MFGKKHPDKPLNDIDHVSDVPGAPGPDGPASSGAPTGDAPRKHGILPYVLAGVAVGIALLTIGTAGLVAYDRATNPAWQQPADGAGEGEPGQTADEDEADADETDAKDDAEAEGSDEAPAEGQPAEEAPAADPAPQESHYFECEYFYVDVSDDWAQDTTAEQIGDNEWNFSHHEEPYLYITVVTTNPEPQSGHQWLVGTTSDGTEVWGNDAANGFFRDGKATITLK